MATPTCPACRVEIPDADINVGTDIAFCRACHTAHRFSALVAMGGL